MNIIHYSQTVKVTAVFAHLLLDLHLFPRGMSLNFSDANLGLLKPCGHPFYSCMPTLLCLLVD